MPLDIDWDGWRLRPWDAPRLLTLFREWGFHRFADEVRAQERHYSEQGIHAVPAVIVNNRYLIQGGQPVEVFERALRRIAAEAAG